MHFLILTIGKIDRMNNKYRIEIIHLKKTAIVSYINKSRKEKFNWYILPLELLARKKESKRLFVNLNDKNCLTKNSTV